MHHFVTAMCTHVHIAVTKWCLVGCGTGALWNLCNRSITKVVSHICAATVSVEWRAYLLIFAHQRPWDPMLIIFESIRKHIEAETKQPHFAADILKPIFVYESCCIWSLTSLKFVPKLPININSNGLGPKRRQAISEPMITYSTDALNGHILFKVEDIQNCPLGARQLRNIWYIHISVTWHVFSVFRENTLFSYFQIQIGHVAIISE